MTLTTIHNTSLNQLMCLIIHVNNLLLLLHFFSLLVLFYFEKGCYYHMV